ncbi:ABC transporter substrate-binding protein [Mycolicibacterium baixiangningiae]|uniref:ABC transporter substrate-binding protein n=1 Tax=Mycolicibacterium baixiangningiae TaxID=2761578 RepID=UPI0018D0CA1E|nr:ABC transporter substrate-binding protein [Mycolicibacterium baixiangningiae]
MRRSRRNTVATAMLAAALGLSGCTDSGDSASENGTQKVDLMVSYQQSLAFIGEIMAQENGYFADEGLDVTLQGSEGGTYVVQQLIAGKIPFGLASTEGTSVAASNGHNLTAISEQDRDIILIGAPEGGDVKSVADLAGKTLGITDPGGGEVGLVNAVLDAEGLTDKVTVLAVGAGGPQVYHALESGQIAAYAGYTNDLAGVESSGTTFANILPDEFRGMPANSFVLSAEATDEDRATLVKLVRAWNRGTVAALNDPDKALEVGCRYVPEECENMGTARSYLTATLHGVAPRAGKKLGEYDYTALELQASVLAADALGDQPIDFGSIFTNDYIAETNDFDSPSLHD